jgi:predicted acyltransferase
MIKKNRYKPLDIFRGMTIAFMIIVNTPGDWSNTFSLLLHADWHGFTPTDLVFPSFLFAVGNAMAFVSAKWENESTQKVLLKGFKRAGIIFLIGYLLYWFPFFRPVDGQWVFKPFESTRVFGVLQRIGFCYALSLPLIYFLSKRQLIWGSGLILLIYWGLMDFFGDYTLEGNLALKLDLWMLGPSHMYGGEGIPFDPEGILSSLPAVVNIIGGYLVGLYIKNNQVGYEQLSKILLTAAALMIMAYLWHPLFPINKKIWTSSYVLLTIGLDMIILGIIIYLMEMYSKRYEFKVFNTFGINPLFIYLLSGLLAKGLILFKVDGQSMYGILYRNGFAWIGDKFGSLAFALFITSICYLVARWLEQKKIYIKI